MDHDLENLIADCRDALKNGATRESLEKVRGAIVRALQNSGFVATHFGGDREPGRDTLYHDPDLDFYIYAHFPDGAILNPPHDHASAWAAYGQAMGYTQMTDWAIPPGADLPDPVRTYRLEPGMAGFYDVGALHSIDMPASSRFLRITATDIDALACKYYDEVDTRQAIADRLGR
jgi:hypothetical protein